MKYLPVVVMAQFFAGTALAGETQAMAGSSLLGSILQMLAALSLVVGMILMFYYVSNRWLKAGMPVGTAHNYIRHIETRFIAPKKSLILVEVGGEYLLLSSSGEGLQFIKQVEMMEEIEVLEGQGLARLVPATLHNKIIDLVARLPKRNDAAATDLRARNGRAS